MRCERRTMTVDATGIEALDLPLAGSRRRAMRGLVNRSLAGCNRGGMDDDDELIARVAGGDDTALRELFFRHAPWLAARLRMLLLAADVEDVLQETFLAAWRGAEGYRAQGAGGGWLWGIARRQAALLLRRRGPASAVLSEPVAVSGEMAGDPADVAVWRADLEAAVQALGSSESEERVLWQLLYVEDRPVAEVAELMGVPPGTVKSRAHRVRQLLRAALGGRSVDGGSE